eukprot:355455-Chlamydomonas_euryale.AAC.1
MPKSTAKSSGQSAGQIIGSHKCHTARDKICRQCTARRGNNLNAKLLVLGKLSESLLRKMIDNNVEERRCYYSSLPHTYLDTESHPPPHQHPNLRARLCQCALRQCALCACRLQSLCQRGCATLPVLDLCLWTCGAKSVTCVYGEGIGADALEFCCADKATGAGVDIWLCGGRENEMGIGGERGRLSLAVEVQVQVSQVRACLTATLRSESEGVSVLCCERLFVFLHAQPQVGVEVLPGLVVHSSHLAGDTPWVLEDALEERVHSLLAALAVDGDATGQRIHPQKSSMLRLGSRKPAAPARATSAVARIPPPLPGCANSRTGGEHVGDVADQCDKLAGLPLSALGAKDAHQPHSDGTRSARAGKKRGPRMVSRRPVTTHGRVTERC